MSKVHTYYLPTYLADKAPDTGVTLMVRKFQRYRNKAGTYTTRYTADAIKYPTADDMAAAIKSEGMRELPIEAETDPTYIPPRHRSKITRKVSKL